MLTALAVSDRDGGPIAPLCVELRAQSGLHTTRCGKVQNPQSQLDGLEPVMDHVTSLQLGKPADFGELSRVVSIIDREADSVLHYRRWDSAGKKFLIRANDSRHVLHEGKERRLCEVADDLRRKLKPSRSVCCSANDDIAGDDDPGGVKISRAPDHAADSSRRSFPPKRKRITCVDAIGCTSGASLVLSFVITMRLWLRRATF
jgi:hypothetical protein